MKKVMLFLLSILLISSVYGLTTYPDEFSTTIIQDTLENYTMEVFYNLTNTPHNFTIYNITFSSLPYFDFGVIDQLDVNETKSFNFTIRTNETFDTTFLPKLEYFYLVDSIKEPENYTIAVLGNGFNPTLVEMNKQDILIFDNLDTINHTITDLDTNNQLEVMPNASVTFLLDEIKVYNFVDEQSNIGLEVNVTTNDIQAPTRDDQLYEFYDFKVKSIYEVENFSMDFLAPSSQINYNEKTSGLIIFRTNEDLFNINLVSDNWLNFSRNNFNLSQDTYVFFNVTPRDIKYNNQTDKTYSKEIKITGDNIADKTISFDIYVKPANVTEVEGDKTKFIFETMTAEDTIQYCENKYGDDPRDWEGTCEIIVVNITTTEYKDRILNPDLTEEKVQQYFSADERFDSDLGTLKTIIQDTDKKSNEKIDLVVEAMENLSKQVNENTQKTQDTKQTVDNFKKNENVKTYGGMIIGFVVVIGLIIFAFKRNQWVKAMTKKRRI